MDQSNMLEVQKDNLVKSEIEDTNRSGNTSNNNNKQVVNKQKSVKEYVKEEVSKKIFATFSRYENENKSDELND